LNSPFCPLPLSLRQLIKRAIQKRSHDPQKSLIPGTDSVGADVGRQRLWGTLPQGRRKRVGWLTTYEQRQDFVRASESREFSDLLIYII
jgi:hypothetical protein